MKDYIKLIKVRISLLVLLTGYLGYYLGLRYEGLYNDYQTLIKYIKDNHYNYENINICNQFAKQHLSLTKGYNIYKKIYAEIS